MSTSPNAWKEALTFIWIQYRVWAATSRGFQAKLSSWRRRVLIFGIAGAVIGTLSSQPSIMALIPSEDIRGTLAKALGFVSAGLLALATYFTKEVLSPANESRWIRARAAAEAFKREAYLLLGQAPPYDGPITPASLDRANKIARDVEDLDKATIGEDEKKKGMPDSLLTVDRYISDRVIEQKSWYEKRAKEHREVADRIKNVSVVFGALAALLGVLGALWPGVPAFVAVITTITTSLATYLYAGRYEYLVVSYLATASKLDGLIAGWGLSGKTEAERKKFVQDCEGTFAAENSGWMATWTKPGAQEQG